MNKFHKAEEITQNHQFTMMVSSMYTGRAQRKTTKDKTPLNLEIWLHLMADTHFN